MADADRLWQDAVEQDLVPLGGNLTHDDAFRLLAFAVESSARPTDAGSPDVDLVSEADLRNYESIRLAQCEDGQGVRDAMLRRIEAGMSTRTRAAVERRIEAAKAGLIKRTVEKR